MENKVDIDQELLKAIQMVRPLQLWAARDGRFILMSGLTEMLRSRNEVVEILNRERAALEVKANMIQTALDLVKGN